jgi:hypothetical protein
MSDCSDGLLTQCWPVASVGRSLSALRVSGAAGAVCSGDAAIHARPGQSHVVSGSLGLGAPVNLDRFLVALMVRLRSTGVWLEK